MWIFFPAEKLKAARRVHYDKREASMCRQGIPGISIDASKKQVSSIERGRINYADYNRFKTSLPDAHVTFIEWKNC